MLQGIRDRAHGFIAWIVVILISIPFALWGVQEYLGPDPNAAVAEVDGEEISLFDYQRALQAARSALDRQFPGQDASRIFGESLIRDRAMNELIRERLVVRAASEAGFTISDEQLASAIRSVPAFQRDGGFSAEEYSFAMRRVGFTPGRFEEDTRLQLLEAQWRDAFISSAVVAERRARRLAALRSQRRAFSRLVVPAARFEGSDVEEEEVAKHYDVRRAGFMTLEEVRLRYLMLAREDLAAEVEIPSGTLEAYYEARKAGFTVEEQRRVSHILITEEEGGEEGALSRAEALRERILGGEAFENVAREASQDPGSADLGGDLGYGGRGIWVPPFEEAVFSLPVGELSEPIRSEFGFHLIRVAEVRESRTRSFEEVRDELEGEYRGEQADQLYFEQIERLSSLVFEQPDNLEDAANVLGLTVRESGWLSRGGGEDEVFGDPAVMAAAFDEDVLAGNNSEPVELDGYRTVVLRVEDRRAPRQRTLDEVRSEIVEALRVERAAAAARDFGVALLGRLRAGEAMEAVAGDLTWSEERTAGRDAPDIAPLVRAALFDMPHPAGGETVFDGVAEADGDFMVIALHQVIEDEAEAFEEVREVLSQSAGLAAFSAFVAGLRERADIRIQEDRLTVEDTGLR